jgi:PAS domain S-box-containing protein
LRNNIEIDRRKHDLYRVLFENIYEGLLLIDCDTGDIKDANKQTLNMFGYSFDEIIKLKFKDLLISLDNLDDILACKLEKFTVFWCKKKDSSIFPVKLNLTKVDIEQNIFILSVLYDISIEKEKDDALRISEAKYKTILNNMRDIVFEYHTDSYIISYVSPSCNRIGYSEEDIIGKSIFKFIYSEDTDKIKQVITNFLSAKPSRPFILKIKSKSNKAKWFEINSNIVTDDFNNIIKIVSVARDITQSKILQENIIKSENRYKAIVEDQVELIYRFGEDGILTFVNNAYCKYFSTNKHDIIGRYYWELIPEKSVEFVKKSFNSLTPQNPFNQYDSEIILANGESRWIHWSDRLIIHNGDSNYEYQSIGFDITERKYLEQELLKSNSKYRAILDNLQDGFFQTNSFGHFCFISNSFLEILEYSDRGELLGLFIKDIFFDPNEYNNIIRVAKSVGGKLQEYETKIVTKSKKIIDISINLQMIYSTRGHLVTIQGIIRDITEFKRRFSEINKLYKIVEKSRSALVVIELNGTITYANPAVIEIIKCTEHKSVNEYIIGKKIKSFIIFDDNTMDFSKLCSIIDKEGKWFGSAHIYCPYSNNGKVPIDIIFSKVEIDNNIFIVASFNDTSEMIRLNNKIKEQSRLYEELQQEITTLVEQMSEFNSDKFESLSMLEEAFSDSVKRFKENDEESIIPHASI